MAGSTPLQKGSREFEDENGSSSMRTAETMLCLLPMRLCVVALVIMLKNSLTNDLGSLSYSDLGTFTYLVHANDVCRLFGKKNYI